MIQQVYLSGALTGLASPEEYRTFYEALAGVCAEAGIKVYIPHLATDPVKNPGLSPRDVYELDRSQVLAADLVVAYAGFPSLGVGMELEIANQAGIPVVLLAESEAPLSRMARGCPAVIGEIRFASREEALEGLRSWLMERPNDRIRPHLPR